MLCPRDPRAALPRAGTVQTGPRGFCSSPVHIQLPAWSYAGSRRVCQVHAKPWGTGTHPGCPCLLLRRIWEGITWYEWVGTPGQGVSPLCMNSGHRIRPEVSETQEKHPLLGLTTIATTSCYPNSSQLLFSRGEEACGHFATSTHGLPITVHPRGTQLGHRPSFCTSDSQTERVTAWKSPSSCFMHCTWKCLGPAVSACMGLRLQQGGERSFFF